LSIHRVAERNCLINRWRVSRSGYDHQWSQALLVQVKRVVELGTEGTRWPPRVLLCPQHYDGVCRALVVALADSRHSQCYVRRPQEGWECEDHGKQQYHPYSVLLTHVVSISRAHLELGSCRCFCSGCSVLSDVSNPYKAVAEEAVSAAIARGGLCTKGPSWTGVAPNLVFDSQLESLNQNCARFLDY
jgi:hypothetical protein